LNQSHDARNALRNRFGQRGRRQLAGADCGGLDPRTRYSRIDRENGAWITATLAGTGERW
jgi:hypothetical protein